MNLVHNDLQNCVDTRVVVDTFWMRHCSGLEFRMTVCRKGRGGTRRNALAKRNKNEQGPNEQQTNERRQRR